MGNAHRTGAFAEAATLCLRGNEPGQTSLARVETKHEKGNALRILAHKRARAVYCMLTRHTAFDVEQFLRPSGRRAGEPGAERDTQGMRLHQVDVMPIMAASWNAKVSRGPISLRPAR